MAKTRTSGVKHIVVSMTNLTDGRKRIVTRIVTYSGHKIMYCKITSCYYYHRVRVSYPEVHRLL